MSASTTALHMEVDVDPGEMELETSEVRQLSQKAGQSAQGAQLPHAARKRTALPPISNGSRGTAFVKGFRRVLHVVPDDLSEGALFRENIKLLGGSRFTFDLCVLPHQIPKAIALADLVPDRAVRARPLRRSRYPQRRRTSLA